MIITDPNLYTKYKEVICNEAYLAEKNAEWNVVKTSPDYIYGITRQLIEICKSCTIPRSYINRYHLSEDTISYMSIGAHTNIMMSILDAALKHYPKHDECTILYTYQAIMGAARRHDLPENITGDIPDDGSRDEAEKIRRETEYHKEYSEFTKSFDSSFEKDVLELLDSMNKREQEIGKLLYLSDKLSAILEVLCYDNLGKYPKIHIDEGVSPQDQEAMKMCDCFKSGEAKASEIWTINQLKQRGYNAMDSSGFFTAVLVMATLIINGRWYSWREKDYPT